MDKKFSQKEEQNTGLQEGENGTLEWTDEGVGDMNVVIFNQTVRDIGKEALFPMIDKSINNVSSCAEPLVSMRAMVDLVILCFQTRNCRGGKGEKLIFYNFFERLYREYPNTILATLPLISHYGYYKDFFMLLERLNSPESQNDQQVQLREAIINLIKDDIRKDEENLNIYESDNSNDATKKTLKISLLAKYMPRKNGHFSKGSNKWIYEHLKNALYPECHNASEQYRKLISRLSLALEIPEIYMCAKRYHEIEFGKVASRCMNKFSKAFLNEKKGQTLLPSEEETGNRFPELEDRVQARQNLKALLVDQKMTKLNGKQLQPHEIVKIFMYRAVSSLEELVYTKQWDSIREGVLESLQSIEGNSAGVDLGKLVPLVDVSGSMSGIPMEVAIAMGILVSEVNHRSFRNRMITFSSNPEWVVLPEGCNIRAKVSTAREAPWGFDTNFVAAMDLILEIVEKERLPKEEIPNLIVFSDMQFNAADPRSTMHEQIKARFAEVGNRICGEPYEPPMIIYWNLRATLGNAAKADEGNVMLLSGFSPSLLKLVLSGENLLKEETVVDEDGNQRKVCRQVTPYETMRSALDDSLYDPVRKVLVDSMEPPFDDYTKEMITKSDLTTVSAESSAF